MFVIENKTRNIRLKTRLFLYPTAQITVYFYTINSSISVYDFFEILTAQYLLYRCSGPPHVLQKPVQLYFLTLTHTINETKLFLYSYLILLVSPVSRKLLSSFDPGKGIENGFLLVNTPDRWNYKLKKLWRKKLLLLIKRSWTLFSADAFTPALRIISS